MTREKLRDTRYDEQRKAAKILGVKHVVFLGYEDGYLYPTLEVRKDVARQVRIHKPDVIITMGCGDACPVFPGKRYEDWKLDDPAGQGIDVVRPIRDDIHTRVRTLVAELLPDKAVP